MNILILGNSSDINDFNFDLLKNKDSNLIVAGVNRIWFKYIPDYLYFSDHLILKELEQSNNIVNDTNIITTAHYKDMGIWMKKVLKNFEKNN